MRERIKELILQAGFENAFAHPEDGFEVVFVDEEHTTEALEKFALLIVRECADVAAAHDALDIYEEIREHFGV